MKSLYSFANNKKSGYERESAAIGIHSLATILGPSAGPALLPALPVLYELYMDKGDVVRTTATSAAKAIIKLFPPESTRLIFRNLEENLEKAKWKGKVGILDAIKSFVPTAKIQVANQLGEILPKVEAAMHDTKSEVRSPINFHGVPNPSFI